MLQECRQKLKEAQGQIEIHKGEYKSLEEILKKKEKKMQDYKFKISDLQKSKVKYILNQLNSNYQHLINSMC